MAANTQITTAQSPIHNEHNEAVSDEREGNLGHTYTTTPTTNVVVL